MQLYLIRHAQSLNNELWYRTGDSIGRSDDPDLTQLGKIQAKLLAEYLTQDQHIDFEDGDDDFRDERVVRIFPFTHLYTSLMQRAVKTAMAIGDQCGLCPVAWIDLHENGGIYLDEPDQGVRVGQPGKPRSFFKSHFPKLVIRDDFGEQGWWNRPFEEKAERRQRAGRVINTLLEQHGATRDRVAMVIHAGFYNQMVFKLLSLPEDTRLWFKFNNTAITRIDFYEEGTAFCFMNRTVHLPYELVT